MRIDYSKIKDTQKSVLSEDIVSSGEFDFDKMKEQQASGIIKDDEEDDDNEDNNSKPSNSQAVNPEIYSGIFSYFAEKEGIDTKDIKIESTEDFENLFQEKIIEKRVQDKIDARFKDASAEVKDFLSVKEYFDSDVEALNFTRNLNALKSFSDEQMQEEELQELVYKDYLLTVKNNTEEEVEELIEEAKTLSVLDTKADMARKKLISWQSEKLDEFKSSKENKKKTEEETKKKSLNDYINAISSVEKIGEIQVTQELKKAATDSFSKVVKVENGKSYTEFTLKQKEHPIEIEKAIQYMNALGLLNVDKDGKWTPDFSKLSSITSKGVKRKLDELIRDGANQSGKVGVTSGDYTPLSDLGYT